MLSGLIVSCANWWVGGGLWGDAQGKVGAEDRGLELWVGCSDSPSPDLGQGGSDRRAVGRELGSMWQVMDTLTWSHNPM